MQSDEKNIDEYVSEEAVLTAEDVDNNVETGNKEDIEEAESLDGEKADESNDTEAEGDAPADTDFSTPEGYSLSTVSEDEIGAYIPPKGVSPPPPISDDELADGGMTAKRTAFLNSVFDFVELFVFTLVAVLLITSFIIRPSIVDGDSMQNTLENGDVLLISDFLYTPKRGDIIVLEDYSTELKKPIVKRVIAVGGDIIRISRTTIYVNGQPLDESEYLRIDYPLLYQYDTVNIYPHLDNPTLEYGPDYYQLEVPMGELFVMGDHRNASTDSRAIGTIKEESVLGKVVLKVYPFGKQEK